MSVPEKIFLGLLVYVAVEVIALPISALRGKNVGGRVITWLVALMALLAVWFFFLAEVPSRVTT